MATPVKYNGPYAAVDIRGSDGETYHCPKATSVSVPDDTAIALFAQGTFTAPDGSTPGYTPSAPTVIEDVFLANGVLSKRDATGHPTSVSSGSGAAHTIAGPTLPSLSGSTEYVWSKTDGDGNLLDIVSFKTDSSGNVPVGVS